MDDSFSAAVVDLGVRAHMDGMLKYLVQHCTNEELPGSGQASVPIDNEGSESEEIGFPPGNLLLDQRRR